jgi:hypothetical protein
MTKFLKLLGSMSAGRLDSVSGGTRACAERHTMNVIWRRHDTAVPKRERASTDGWRPGLKLSVDLRISSCAKVGLIEGPP